MSLISNIHFSASIFNNIKHYSKEMLKDVSGILNEFLNMVSVHLKHLIDNTSLQQNTSYYKQKLLLSSSKGNSSAFSKAAVLFAFVLKQLTSTTEGLLAQEKVPKSFLLLTWAHWEQYMEDLHF